MIADASRNVMIENIVAYLCIAAVLVTGILAWALLVLFDKVDPPSWMRKKDKVP